MLQLVCLVLYCVVIHSEGGRATSSSRAILGSRANSRLVAEDDYVGVKTSSLDHLLSIRGGADKKVDFDIVASIQLKFVAFLKIIVPRSFWPKSWKSKSSKLMSKEHLEKSFAKGDSNSRVQKVLSSCIVLSFWLLFPVSAVFLFLLIT